MKPVRILFWTLLVTVVMTVSAQARIDWSKTNSIQINSPIIDIASSTDGKHVFILTSGKVHIYTNTGKLKDSFEVSPDTSRISVSGLDMANIGNKIFLSSDSTGRVEEISYSHIVDINTEGSPFLGEADAPVVVALFSDFQ